VRRNGRELGISDRGYDAKTVTRRQLWKDEPTVAVWRYVEKGKPSSHRAFVLVTLNKEVA
jgi:hypothetical protein